jgi:hypothetical protein
MSGARILFPDFREEQADSRYPFKDTASLTAVDGVTQMRKDTFVDAVLYVINATNRLFISSVTIAPQKISLTVSDSTNRVVATSEFSPNPIQAPPNGVLPLVDLRGRPAGSLISSSDKLTLFAGWGVGTYEFLIDATEFVASVVIPAQEPGVRGVLPPTKELMTGDIWLIGDGGVVLRHEGVQDGKNIIRVDITGVPLFKRFACLPFDRFEAKTFIRTINGCDPDEFGNFILTASSHEAEDTVLRISQQPGTLKFETVGRKVV